MERYIYGFRAISEALAQDIIFIGLYYDFKRKDQRIKAVLAECTNKDIKTEAISWDDISSLAESTKHQGVIARIISKTAVISFEDILSNIKPKDIVLLLDNLTDVNNIGSCLRIAEASGVKAIISSKNGSPELNASISKVSSGASELIPYIRVNNLSQAINDLKDHGMFILGFDDKANNSIFDLKIEEEPLGIVIGSEEKGLRRLTAKSCDSLVNIPMYGSISSLNAAVSTAVSTYIIRLKQSHYNTQK